MRGRWCRCNFFLNFSKTSVTLGWLFETPPGRLGVGFKDFLLLKISHISLLGRRGEKMNILSPIFAVHILFSVKMGWSLGARGGRSNLLPGRKTTFLLERPIFGYVSFSEGRTWKYGNFQVWNLKSPFSFFWYLRYIYIQELVDLLTSHVHHGNHQKKP